MATRRARIKAIVNVPARRPKQTEGTTSSDGAKAEKNVVTDKLTKPLPNSSEDKTDGEASIDERTTIGVSVRDKHNEENSENTLPSEKSSANICNDDVSLSCGVSTEVDSLPQNKIDASFAEAEILDSENVDASDNASKSSSEQPAGDNSTTQSDSNKSKEVPQLSSPIKQRSRLFIRPSPKLVDSSGRRRFPSGARHKASSESEDESRTRSSSTTEETDTQNVASSENSSSAVQEKAPKSQENLLTNASDSTSAERKNGARAGRQRAKNKENLASHARRRLWQKMKKGNGGTTFDRTRLTMFDYIYYNPVSNPMRSSSESSVKSRNKSDRSESSDVNNALAEEQVDDPGEAGGSLLEENMDNESGTVNEESEECAMPAPRVKVGPDGELILDEQSLVIETTGLKEGLKDLENGPAVVETSSFTNYSTFSKRTKGHDWSENETLRFYRALNVVGTDFSLMQNLLFASRSRRDLKNKFKREERRNPTLIEKALRYPGVFSNVQELQTEFAKSDPAEKSKTVSKRGRGGRGRGVGRKAAKDVSQPAKRRRKKKWLVSDHTSEGNSDSEDEESSILSAREEDKRRDPSPDKFSSGLYLPPDPVLLKVTEDDVMMASQEIVMSNERSPSVMSEDREGSIQMDDNEVENEDDSDGGESEFLSRVLQPTRSGRVPKRREVNDVYEKRFKKIDGEVKKIKPLESQVFMKVSKEKRQLITSEVQKEIIVCAKEVVEENSVSQVDPLAINSTDGGRPSQLNVGHVSGIDPSSVVLLTTPPNDQNSQLVTSDNQKETVVCVKEVVQESSVSRMDDPLAIHPTDEEPPPPLNMDHVSGMEPGSLVVLATSAPDDPSRQVYQVFMVSPDIHGPGTLLIPQNLNSHPESEAVIEDRERAQQSSSSFVRVRNSSVLLPTNVSLETVDS